MLHLLHILTEYKNKHIVVQQCTYIQNLLEQQTSQPRGCCSIMRGTINKFIIKMILYGFCPKI